MALSTDSELKDQILYNLEEYSEDGEIPAYESDFIVGFAETQMPIYYNQIIQQWMELPDDYRDTWNRNVSIDENATITWLMSLDLYNYYNDRTSEILDEIRQERDNG